MTSSKGTESLSANHNNLTIYHKPIRHWLTLSTQDPGSQRPVPGWWDPDRCWSRRERERRRGGQHRGRHRRQRHRDMRHKRHMHHGRHRPTDLNKMINSNNNMFNTIIRKDIDQMTNNLLESINERENPNDLDTQENDSPSKQNNVMLNCTFKHTRMDD